MPFAFEVTAADVLNDCAIVAKCTGVFLRLLVWKHPGAGRVPVSETAFYPGGDIAMVGDVP